MAHYVQYYKKIDEHFIVENEMHVLHWKNWWTLCRKLNTCIMD